MGAASVGTNQEGHHGGSAKAIDVAEIAVLRRHLQGILQSPAFRGSKRSQDFLKHIVETAILGRLEALKERTIGVDLFGRSPDYDTGEDAIVRVTASDVRRRLLQYYGESGSPSEVRIELPLGAYVPDFRHTSVVSSSPVVSLPLNDGRGSPKRMQWRLSPFYAVLVASLAVLLILDIVLQLRSHAEISSSHASFDSVLPWAALFTASSPLTVVTSDTDLVEVQDITQMNVSLTDYANQKYIPRPDLLNENTRRICLLLRGDHAATIDTDIALEISRIAHSQGQELRTRPARSLTMLDLQTDDNFIFLGSPRSDPWVSLFDDQLDFSFKYDRDRKCEVILNKHPRPGELPVYIPTARGGETGDAFAIAAFVPNPNQKGHVLVFAGSNAEGTEGVARLVTNRSALAGVLGRSGIPASGPIQYFEMLLRLRTIGGSARNTEVLSVHRLRA